MQTPNKKLTFSLSAPMNQAKDESNIVDLLCKQLVDHSLHHLCDTSLKLIENASKDQISAALDYNQHQINILIIQLLTINLIGQNQKEFQHDIQQQQQRQHQGDHEQSYMESECQTYCERKLLSLSPMIGFSRKNYFLECKISDDVQMEILSYLEPIRLFRSILLINKQFNKNVTTMHQSYKYENMFCNKNFAFESFAELTFRQSKYIDYRMSNGYWVRGTVYRSNSRDTSVIVSSDVDRSEIYQLQDKGSRHTATYGRISGRPANMQRFLNILKHGYFSEVCDVNLKDFYFWASDNTYVKLIENNDQDMWRCGWIDFDWTWNEMVKQNNMIFGVDYAGQFLQRSNENIPENSQNSENETGGKKWKFRPFQIRVQVDITQEYYNNTALKSLPFDKSFNTIITDYGECLISLVFHTDDVDNITYFGHKTREEEQLKAKQETTNWFVASENGCRISESKAKLLDAVGYPNYCILTPNGVFSALSSNEKERKQFNKWYNDIDCDDYNEKGAMHMVYENECINVGISPNGVNKVYYDKIKDELLIKISPHCNYRQLILEDVNAPPPLKQRYCLQHGSPCRFIDAKIVDPKLIDKVRRDNDVEYQYPNEKETRYFELLREWKGFIKVSIDITKEFNQFEQSLKHDYFIDDNINYNAKYF